MQKTIVATIAIALVVSLNACENEVPPPPTQPGLQPGIGEPGNPPPGFPAMQGMPGLPEPSSGGIAPPPPGSGTGETALVWTVPAAWTTEPPSTSMRKAQYRVPGKAGDAQCVVFYFGPGQGGPPEANVKRWADQFRLADGKPGSAAMQTGSKDVNGIAVLTVETTGTYLGGFAMGGAAPTPKAGQMLLGAVAKGPDANWFFKLTGPAATVQAQRAAFDAMLSSLRSGD
jgi:hypothetical protein